MKKKNQKNNKYIKGAVIMQKVDICSYYHNLPLTLYSIVPAKCTTPNDALESDFDLTKQLLLPCWEVIFCKNDSSLP